MEEEKNKKTKKILIRGLKIVGIIVIVVIALNIFFPTKSGKLTTISEVSLKEIIEINELSTIDYTYNATATKYKKDKPIYYVAYEGVVTAGINFSEIDIDVDENKKKVTITIPDVEIHDVIVDMGTMEYIFENKKYESEDITEEAYKLCKNDLNERLKNEKLLNETAKLNAISSVEALFKPWILSVDDEYNVEVK